MGQTSLIPPTFADVPAARPAVGRHPRRAPLNGCPSLDRRVEQARAPAEGSGAASPAGALRPGERLAGRTAAPVLSGGNITVGRLRRALAY